MNVLWVDDHPSARRVGRSLLAGVPGLDFCEAGSKEEAFEVLARRQVDLAFVDVRLSGDPRNRDGQFVVKRIRESTSAIPVVVSSLEEVAEIKAALRNGAYDYLLKDFLSRESLSPLLERVRMGVAARELHQQVPPSQVIRREAQTKFVGISPAAERIRALAGRFAFTDRPVLVEGPTGAGKEVVARLVHELSERADRPMLCLNCGALPANLVESQLFGHRKGAFTGAGEDREGHFQAVGEGTLFLDEIGELPLELQPKILRVLENRTFLPVGSSAEVEFKGRIVAATHVDLEALVAERKFREDLLYRLNVLRIAIPPLRERREDIPPLALMCLSRQRRKMSLTEGALRVFSSFDWPGNVRQLRNTIDLLAVLHDEPEVTEEMALEVLGGGKMVPGAADPQVVESAIRDFVATDFAGDKLRFLEDAAIACALERAEGNKSAAAKLLGVHRKVVQRRVEEDPAGNGDVPRSRESGSRRGGSSSSPGGAGQ